MGQGARQGCEAGSWGRIVGQGGSRAKRRTPKEWPLRAGVKALLQNGGSFGQGAFWIELLPEMTILDNWEFMAARSKRSSSSQDTLPAPAANDTDTLATPLPQCLTDGTSAQRALARPIVPSIPRAPRMPDVTRQLTPSIQISGQHSAHRRDTGRDLSGLPSDRLEPPGSPAVVSTFRPKPRDRSCYSFIRSFGEERVFRPRRATGGKAGRKPGRG